MINRVRLYLGDPDDGNKRHDDAWWDWAEKAARDLERDAKAVDDGEMDVEDFDLKW